MIRYGALRISLLVVVGALLYLAGLRGILLAGAAIIIAALISYIFFPAQRDAAAKRLEEFRGREEKPRIPDEDMTFEDAVVEDAVVEDASVREPSEQPRAEEGESDSELD